MGAKYVWGGDPDTGLTFQAWCLLAEEGEAGRPCVVGGAEWCVELEVAGPEGLETECCSCRQWWWCQHNNAKLSGSVSPRSPQCKAW